MSPVANLIENVWRIIEAGITKKCGGSAGLVGTILPLCTVRKLIDSMPRRVAAVVAAKGGHTKHQPRPFFLATRELSLYQ